jgi:hypothetical protein
VTTVPFLPPPFELLVDPRTGTINEVWYRFFSDFRTSIYEEGEWTPVFDPQTGAFTSVTYDADVWGRYIKIGNLVTFQCRLATDAITVGTAADDLSIEGLPYAARARDEGYQTVSVGFAASFVGEEPISGIIPQNSTQIALYYRATVDGNTSASQVADLDTGANDNLIYVGGSYITE